MDPEAAAQFEAAVRTDGRFPLEAYEFLHRGLEFAARRVHGEAAAASPRHVSGPQLCAALRDYALERWGPLARTVLSRWNIHTTRDFGEMVFLMIALGVMGKQESDRIEDFDDVFQFDDAFSTYEISLDAVSE